LFWKLDYYEVTLHMRAYRQKCDKDLERAAWQVSHLHRAFSGTNISVAELLGRGQRYDLINDPYALERLKEDRNG
jgi:hypothetical protein